MAIDHSYIHLSTYRFSKIYYAGGGAGILTPHEEKNSDEKKSAEYDNIFFFCDAHIFF